MNTTTSSPAPDEAHDNGDSGLEASNEYMATTYKLAWAFWLVLKGLSDHDRRLVHGALAGQQASTVAGTARVQTSWVALHRCDEAIGAPLSKQRYEQWRGSLAEKGVPSAGFIINTFGSWSRALDTAGLGEAADIRAQLLSARVRGRTSEELVTGLRRCAADIGAPFTFKRYEAWARKQLAAGTDAHTLAFNSHTFIKHFGGFHQALAQAGLPSERRGPTARRELYKTQELLDSVRLAGAAVAPDPLTMVRYDQWRSNQIEIAARNGQVAVIASLRPLISRHSNSWANVLVAAGLLPENLAGTNFRGRGRRVPTLVRAQALWDAITELGPALRQNDYIAWRVQQNQGLPVNLRPSHNIVCGRLTWHTTRDLTTQAIHQDIGPQGLANLITQAEEQHRDQ